MGQFSKVLLAIDSAHTLRQRAMDCRPWELSTTSIFTMVISSISNASLKTCLPACLRRVVSECIVSFVLI